MIKEFTYNGTGRTQNYTNYKLNTINITEEMGSRTQEETINSGRKLEQKLELKLLEYPN